MDFREYWKGIGGSYDTVCGNMGSERMVLKFAKRYAKDQTLTMLKESVASGDIETAFRHAHTLKGLALNLGFGDMARDAAELTETLRAGNMDQAIYDKVMDDQEKILAMLELLP